MNLTNQSTDTSAELDTTSGKVTNTPLSNIVLDAPISRGDQVITTLHLRRPNAGELHGIKLADLLQMDVSALALLVPRVSSPALTAADVGAGPCRPGHHRHRGGRVFLVEVAAGIPVCVEEFIADIATVFAFSLSELSQMSLIELIEWRERARGDEVELSSGDKFFP